MTTTNSNNQKTTKIIYWIATILFVAFDSGGALGMNTPPAIQGIRHLGFPDYFRYELSIGKIIGGIILVLPMIPARLKEWAYVGFGISCISAIIANLAVDGASPMVLAPVIVMLVLIVSYVFYHKIRRSRALDRQ